MNRDHWGPDGPPEEAYSRVTDAERFRPLHKATLELIDRLEVSFELERLEGYGLDPELEIRRMARQSVRLTPRGDFRAPMIFKFSVLPGLAARFGRWYTAVFTDCGCDACGSNADEEFSRLNQAVAGVVSGRFREPLTVPGIFGDGQIETELWSYRSRHSSKARVDRARAKEMLSGKKGETIAWLPWLRYDRCTNTSPYAP